MINPMAIEHQIESAVIQTTSRAMLEEVTFDTANVTSLDWRSYPILTMADAPKVKSVLINRPDMLLLTSGGMPRRVCSTPASAARSG